MGDPNGPPARFARESSTPGRETPRYATATGDATHRATHLACFRSPRYAALLSRSAACSIADAPPSAPMPALRVRDEFRVGQTRITVAVNRPHVRAPVGLHQQ